VITPFLVRFRGMLISSVFFAYLAPHAAKVPAENIPLWPAFVRLAPGEESGGPEALLLFPVVRNALAGGASAYSPAVVTKTAQHGHQFVFSSVERS
jgi:hypothetical protein